MAHREFPGNPRLYRRIACWTTIAMFVWLYGGFALIQYWWNGWTWLLGWKPLVFGLLFALWYGRFAYRWMMRLDGQYGRGSGWELRERTVKLPELK